MVITDRLDDQRPRSVPLPLSLDRSVTLQTHRDQHIDPDALTTLLDRPRTYTWTGVRFRGDESTEWMDLWLTCMLPRGLHRMLVEPAAGLVHHQFGWGSMAAVDGTDLADLAMRRADTPDHDRRTHGGWSRAVDEPDDEQDAARSSSARMNSSPSPVWHSYGNWTTRVPP